LKKKKEIDFFRQLFAFPIKFVLKRFKNSLLTIALSAFVNMTT